MGFRDCFRLFRQHPFYDYDDSSRAIDAGGKSDPQQHPVVGALTGRLFRGQPDHDWCLGQHRFGGYGQKIQSEHQLFGVHEVQCRHNVYNLADRISISNHFSVAITVIKNIAVNEKDREILFKLFRDHEDVLGSSRIAMLALQAFINSIQALRCDATDLRDLFTELCEAIKNTEPRIVPLIHLIKAFETEMQTQYGDDLEKTKNEAIRILTSKLDLLKSKVGKVIEHGVGLIKDGDTIIVHTASSDVTQMLAMAREVFQKKFKVIILKQDFVKTKLLIKTLSKAEVELQVVPEYSLSHYIEYANKLFIGAVSVTPDAKVVTAIGTSNIVSLCHLNKMPVYLFANSLKFSHHPSSSQKIHSKMVAKSHDDVNYTLTTHSHDIVDLKLIDYLITEDGKVDKHGMEKYVE